MKTKDYSNVIDEIHNAFYGSVIGTEKSKLLVECGFENAQGSEEFSEMAAYYKQKYPLYKFITDKMALKICKKYNLFIGNTEWYTGFVPEKKLNEIRAFKIDVRDNYEFKISGYPGVDNAKLIQYDELTEFEKGLFSGKYKPREHGMWQDEGWTAICEEKHWYSLTLKYFYWKERRFVIAAPLKQFDLPSDVYVDKELRRIERIEKIALDPIVLKEVKDGYFIVSAWGDEATDPSVQNEINN